KDPEKHKILSVITSLCNNNQILMSPVYYSEGRILCSNDEFLFNLITGLLQWKKKQSETKQIVILSLTNYNLEEGINNPYYFFEKQIKPGKILNGVLNQYIQENLRDKKVKFLYKNINTEEIQKNINENEITIVQLGSVPPDVYDYIYSLSTLPCVFEGEGSASLILNIGKPYFHLVSSDDREGQTTNKLYPPVPANAPNNPSGDQCHNDSLALVNSFEEWEKILESTDGKKTPDQIIEEFINNAYEKGKKYQKYFAYIKNFYNNEVNDKLLGALFSLPFLIDYSED
ncbi:hypothetical protein, partial [Moorena sp. SIO4E2]|uniref:hypothetical protein n=1 Tax=Moorena sp. SIO4E2 TaxID=2607826 RepID=UPI0025799CAE